MAPLSTLPLDPFGPRKLAGVCVAVDTKDEAKMLPATVLAAPMLNRKPLFLIVVHSEQDRLCFAKHMQSSPTPYTITISLSSFCYFEKYEVTPLPNWIGLTCITG